MSEFVARVVIERIDRVTVPKQQVSRSVTRDPREVRRKYEIASFAIRAADLDELRDRVHGMLGAALPNQHDAVEGPVQGGYLGLDVKADDRDLVEETEEEEDEEGP